MHEDLEFFCAGTDALMVASQSAKPTRPVGLADFPCAAAQLAKPTDPVGLADSPVVDSTNLPEKLSNQPSGTSSDVGTDLCDWRAPLLAYLRDPSAKVDKSIR
jgi:hypothetical protein